MYILCMLNIRTLKSCKQTAAEMERLTKNYWSDLGRWLDCSFYEFYVFVCRLPYVSDPSLIEFVSRPKFTLNPRFAPRDCDDKAVLLACWCHGRGIPCRFMASSTKPNKQLHHTFIQEGLNGTFLDGTYRKNEDFIGNYPYFSKLTRLVALTDWF